MDTDFNKDTDYFQDAQSWILVAIEGVSIIAFTYFIYEYCKSYGRTDPARRLPRDKYTISCFVFIMLTIVSRVTLKLVVLTVRQYRLNYRYTHNQHDPQWYLEN